MVLEAVGSGTGAGTVVSIGKPARTANQKCYAQEGPMLVATRCGIQVCADDSPTQVILPIPDRGRVLGVCLGGREVGLYGSSPLARRDPTAARKDGKYSSDTAANSPWRSLWSWELVGAVA